jgi:hypothetical protein
VVAISFVDDGGTGAADIPQYVNARVQAVATATGAVQFPLAAAATDSVRTLKGLQANVVIAWLDPLTFDPGAGAPRFGANADYIAYFGDGWATIPGSPPQWNGSGESAWIWVNHEYVSNTQPTSTTAPTGQHLTLAQHLRYSGQLTNEVTSNVWSDADLTGVGSGPQRRCRPVRRDERHADQDHRTRDVRHGS